MPEYRRWRVPGGTYFFTVNLADRGSGLLVGEVGRLRDAVRSVRARRPFHIDSWVVLPEHMHAMWTLPAGDVDFSGRWREIKKGFVKGLAVDEERSAVMVRRGERGIWQRRFWEHVIRDERDYAAHMNYVHFNPVRHGLVGAAWEWPYSSFRRCVGLGMYAADWGGGGVGGDWVVGERGEVG